MMQQVTLVGRDGYARNLDPTEIVPIDVSVNDWESKEKFGDYLYIGTGGDISLKLIGDEDYTVITVDDKTELRWAVKAISNANTTASGILALR